MNQIISFIIATVFSLLTFFNIPFERPDLQPIDKETVVLTQEQKELFETVFKTETEWLSSLQLDNGAIPMTYAKNGELQMNPYFADFAALALLDNACEYAPKVMKYIDWHFAHLNTAETDYNGIDGTIYDYIITVQNGIVTNETVKETNGQKTYDSTDSYAATFLNVLNKYYNKTSETQYIISKSNDIVRIVNAMLATMHNGLTFAKPDYEIQYLMDNCEVYEGIVSAISLFKNVICANDSTYINVLERLESAKISLQNALEKKLWNYYQGHYRVAINKFGTDSITFSWDNYYPSATAQLFPIMCRVINPNTERAVSLYNRFCEAYKWEEFEIPEDFCWGSNAYTSALMGDVNRTVSYMNNFIKYYADHNYPLYNADSAKVAMAAYIMLQY